MALLKAVCFAIAVFALLLGFIVHPMLPATVPTHWNAASEVDDYGPSWIIAFLFPAIIACVFIGFLIIPKIEVFKENLKACEKHYWLLCLVLLVFFLVFFAITTAPNFGYNSNIGQGFALSFAALFIAMGALMPYFKRNFSVGIRTPWALADDNVWKKTHRFGGKAFIAAGIAALLSAPFPAATFLITIGAVIAAAIAAFIYSFMVFRKEGKNTLLK